MVATKDLDLSLISLHIFGYLSYPEQAGLGFKAPPEDFGITLGKESSVPEIPIHEYSDPVVFKDDVRRAS